ncbi:hypothetical protein [Haloarcula sp. JP-L23]|uniref:hypothetical protein n=1 Tax=Haloarcula sp. JP-L23 TaxID=2716717 RepID=UPI00140EAB7E|nr:hypothetical protein G9465_21675 [Haloarcula sp. JP-L23]
MVVLVSVLFMIVAHHSELFGLMDAGLLFGWLPIQLAYDVGYLLVGVAILYWMAGKVTENPDVDTQTQDASIPNKTPKKSAETVEK